MDEPLTDEEKFGASVLLAISACGLSFLAIVAMNHDFAITIFLVATASLCSMESFRLAPRNRQICALAANIVVFVVVALLATALATSAFGP